jgi:hypothetical protein
MFALPAIAICWIAVRMKRLQLHNDLFRELAQRLGGRYLEGSFVDPKEVTFHHSSTWGRIDSYPTAGNPSALHARVRIAWPSAAVRCEVFPQTVANRVGRLLGMVDIEIGQREFDRDFVINGDDSDRIKQLLTAPVRALLQEVRREADAGDMYMAITRDELLLRRRGAFVSVPAWERFARTAMKLFDELSSGTEPGIQFLNDAPAAAEGDAAATLTATCQICGEAIAADPVLCKTCRTPHHHDCWEYYGQCSTFGCRERGYFRPRRQASGQGRK